MPNGALRKNRIWLMIAASLAVLAGGAFFLALMHWPETAPVYRTDAPSAAETASPEPADARLVKAIAGNSDVVGWITIPGTKIDYPVAQCGDNDYYITHNAEKKESRYGAIFMDYRCDGKALRGNTILYGHHMRDGSMFAELFKYRKKDFFQKHGVVEYKTRDGVTRWEVFSAFETTSEFNYTQTEFGSEQDYFSFIQMLQGKSLFETDITLTPKDHVLTLSTCTYDIEDGRFVAVARRIK